MTAGWVEAARTRLDAARNENAASEHRITIDLGPKQIWFINRSADDLGRALDALDAVLALHRPYDDEMACRACTQAIPVAWPCPTVRAIESGTDG